SKKLPERTTPRRPSILENRVRRQPTTGGYCHAQSPSPLSQNPLPRDDRVRARRGMQRQQRQWAPDRRSEPEPDRRLRSADGGDAADYGTPKDFMVGKRIGGTNVFGGGLALYNAHGTLVGGLGVSGDASCADHNIAWKMRHNLGLDHVPAGVADKKASTDPGDDNIIYDITNGVSASGFGHPECSAAATAIGKALPQTNPI